MPMTGFSHLWLQSLGPRASVQADSLSHTPGNVHNQATSEVASYLKHAFLVQFEMTVFSCSFCFPLVFFFGDEEMYAFQIMLFSSSFCLNPINCLECIPLIWKCINFLF